MERESDYQDIEEED